MSRSEKFSVSNLRRDMRNGTKKPLQARANDYLHAMHENSPDPEKMMHLAEDIGRFKGAEATFLAASAKVEIAQKFARELGQTSLRILSEAGTEAAGLFTGYTPGPVSLKAETLVKEIPLRLSLMEETQPAMDLVEKLYHSRLESIPRMFDIWDKAKHSNKLEEKKALKGIMSETAVGLMLSRYGIYEIGSGWLPISSTLSEDRGHFRGDGDREGWDISIFGESSMSSVDLIHKLQVKSSAYSAATYIDGIDIINVRELEANNASRDGVLAQFILSELRDEHQNCNPSATGRLKQRTEVLLDMFS